MNLRQYAFIFLSAVSTVSAQEYLCAEVKIEILQELTLERQAFEARMRIINDLNLPLNNINVDVTFVDDNGDPVLVSSNPNDPNPDVKFFISENGNGVPASVDGKSDNRFTWLIIPTIASGGESPSGQRYEVGAVLTYTVGNTGEEERIVVSPDDITVLPLPELALDYFLPFDVYGDNPDTTRIIEAPTPFSLGVRIKNIGFGTANSVKIDSAQPKIVENELGLLVNFVITGTEINGVAAPNTLLIDFGDIPPATEGYAAVASWVMESTLSGRFTEFDATVSHGDELGGELTALITNENLHTHTLIREVLVDLPGRDTRIDFLSSERNDPTLIQIFESNGTENEVENNTPGGNTVLPLVSGKYQFTLTGTVGFSFVKFLDPFNGTKVIDRVVRGDGKVLLNENAWLDRSWDKDADEWIYWFNCFDSDNLDNSTYTVTFRTPDALPLAPVLQYIVDRTTRPGTQVGFLVQATDQNSDVINISGDGIPDGALFQTNINEAGRMIKFFNWTPSASQTGTFAIQFTAVDTGGLSDSQVVHIFVTEDENTSGFAGFISRHFGNETDPQIIGELADPDKDGMTNLAEYGQNTNPTYPDRELGPKVAIEEIGNELYLTLTYRRRTDDPTLVFTVKGASSLRSGNPRVTQSSELSIAQDDIPEGLERIKVRDSTPISGSNPRRYLELEVTRQ